MTTWNGLLSWVVLSLLTAGCSGDPLKADVEMFCKATTGTDWKSFVDVGPYVAERLKTDEFRTLLMKPRNGELNIEQFAGQVRALMKQTGVTECRTLDDLARPR